MTDDFEPHRQFLIGVAYRMLGSFAEAEDIVQDAFLRWSATDRSTIEHPRVFLSRVVSRLCLDRMKSATSRREQYAGTWLPEPIVAAPADSRSRVGVVEESSPNANGHGPGSNGGAGAGAATGIGAGDGSGIGPGSGGGTGGGPYRPGSGIEPPRLLREVRADYTEEARQRGISGDVVLEIVVRRDGSVGDLKILQGLGGGLNDRAVQAVRQWRFAPAQRLGAAVDVIVEVAVEFKLR